MVMSEPTEAPSKNMPIAVKDAIPLYNAYPRVTAQLHEFCYEKRSYFLWKSC